MVSKSIMLYLIYIVRHCLKLQGYIDIIMSGISLYNGLLKRNFEFNRGRSSIKFTYFTVNIIILCVLFVSFE